MIKTTVQDAINEQINAEYYSAYLYLSMSAWFEHEGLPGFANWMKTQYQEEISHVMKFFNFLNERGGRVVLTEVGTPQKDWKSALAAFEDALAHEESITARINNLMDLAISESDHATCNFLQWYVKEQVEEEATASNLVNQIRMLQDSKESMYHLDRELAQRVFVDATQE